MQVLLPWLVVMVAVPHELVCTSVQSLSAAAVKDVSSVHGSDVDHLLNTYAGQQLPPLVDRSKIQQDIQHQPEVQTNFQSVPRKQKAPPELQFHQDLQERVLDHQEVVDLEYTDLQQVLQQRLQEENVQQERHHKRVVRQDEADPQEGQQDGDIAVDQQDPPQSDGAQQSPPPSGEAQPQAEWAPAYSTPCMNSGCSCGNVSWAVSVDCANAGLEEVPAGTQPNTVRLILSGNKLRRVGNDSLADLNRVMSVYLDKNEISDVHEDAFSGLRNLRVVDLSDNQLTTLPATAFRSCERLQKLLLSGNPLLLAGGGGPLVQAPSLYWLNLSRCALSGLPDDAFRGVPHLLVLDLSDNQLAVPTYLALEFLTSVRRLPLVGNPVHCCEARPLRERLERRAVSATRRWLPAQEGPEPLCAQPARLRGRPWSAAAVDMEACPRTLDVAAVAGLALLALASAALLAAAALLLLRRRRRARRRRRTHSALRRQQSQEAAEAGEYEPPPKLPGWSGPLSWSGPRYVASFKATQPQTTPTPAVYDDAVGAGRHRKGSVRHRDGPAPPTATYDDAQGEGRASPQYEYIAGPDRPPHHASVPSVLEGCDYYEDA